SLKDGSSTVSTEQVTSYALDPELPVERFVYKPPEGVTVVDGKTRNEEFLAKFKARREDPLLKIGDKAPAFEVPDIDGNTLTLDGLLKGKKALVLHLWCFS